MSYCCCYCTRIVDLIVAVIFNFIIILVLLVVLPAGIAFAGLDTPGPPPSQV
jgi:hypothetical protein